MRRGMETKDFRNEIEGFEEIKKEAAILRKYAFDYSSQKGRAAQIVDLLHPKVLRLRVAEIQAASLSAKIFRLVSEGSYLPPFQAGQYINLTVDVGQVRTSRPYSISSPPNQVGYYEIAVRRAADGFVSNFLLDELQVGDSLESTSPAGNFYYNPLVHGQDLVFLAGGSGITPFMSMIRETTDRGLERKIHLLYGSQRPEDIIYSKELKELTERNGNFKMDIVISDPPPGYRGLTGFLTADLIRKQAGNVSGKTFYLCGPEAMYSFCLKELEALKVPRAKIRTEVFGPPKDVTAQPGWPAEVPGERQFQVNYKGKKTVSAKAAEPLMNSLERTGIVLPASCRSGECSLCRTKLATGKVFQPPWVRLRKSDRVFGYVHPCVAYPLSDVELA
jgi:ferredoxin-NADP reductase